MSTTILPEITERLVGGNRHLVLPINETRSVFATEHRYTESVGGDTYWMIGTIPADAPFLSVDTERIARAALMMIATVAASVAS